MPKALLTTGFIAVFSRIPWGPAHARAVHEFLQVIELELPRSTCWPSGSGITTPSVADSDFDGVSGIRYLPRGGLSWNARCSSEGEPVMDYMEVLQDLGLSYNSN